MDAAEHVEVGYGPLPGAVLPIITPALPEIVLPSNVPLLLSLFLHLFPLEAAPNWWTPLLSSDGSGKVSNEPGTAAIHR